MWAGTINPSPGQTRKARVMDQVTRQKINELRAEVDQEWAFDARKECLSDLMADLIVEYWYQRSYHADYVARGRMLEDMMTQGRMTAIRKQITKHQNEIYYRRLEMQGKDMGVTPDDISRAKEHPAQDLHDFNAKGWGLCPFHSDRKPSLHIHNNRMKCWSGVCAWEGDVIDFVMKKDGLSFAMAVRSLL